MFHSGMDNGHTYETLLKQVREAHGASPALRAFVPFPDDLKRQSVLPLHRRPSELLQSETSLVSRTFPALQNAIVSSCPAMRWRETYKEGAAETEFMDRWGCFSIIGEGGPFTSRQARLFVVYMPPVLYYPWHRHPAEEAYLVISGQAVFKKLDQPDEIASEGDTVLHESEQVHAIETTDSALLCLVFWRNHLNTPPVLVPAAANHKRHPNTAEAAPDPARPQFRVR